MARPEGKRRQRVPMKAEETKIAAGVIIELVKARKEKACGRRTQRQNQGEKRAKKGFLGFFFFFFLGFMFFFF